MRRALVLLHRLSLLHRPHSRVVSAELPQPQDEVEVGVTPPRVKGFEAVLVLALYRRSAERHMA